MPTHNRQRDAGGLLHQVQDEQSINAVGHDTVVPYSGGREDTQRISAAKRLARTARALMREGELPGVDESLRQVMVV